MKWPWQKQRRWSSDRDATKGSDPIESATNWARHIHERDSPDATIANVIVVVETVTEKGHGVFYAGHDMALPPVLVYGLLTTAIEITHQQAFDRRAAQLADVLGEQLLERFEERFPDAPSREEVKRVAGGLLDGPARRVTSDPRDPGQ